MIKLYSVDEFIKNDDYYNTMDEKCSIIVFETVNGPIFCPYIYDDNSDEYIWVNDLTCNTLKDAVNIINKHIHIYSHLVLNQIKTPDGTILTSRHHYDYQQYTDANGEEYMVDGGLEYARRIIGQKEPYEEQSVYSHYDFELVRKSLAWGSYGKKGDEPLHYINLCDMADGHIKAILDQNMGSPFIRRLMRIELNYRKTGNIIKFDKPKKFKPHG